MGAEKRAKASRRREREATGNVHREMERQGVFRRHQVAEFTLRSREFMQRWRAIDGTDREPQDLEAAHALAIEVLEEMKVDMRDVTLKLQRRFNTLAFFCRPDSTRFRSDLAVGAAA